MGNSMRKKGFSYDLDQYSKVPLTALSDDSDEEDVIYGHKVDNGKIELQLMPPQNGKPPRNSKPIPKIVKPDPKNGTVICWVSCILVTCVVIAAVGAFKLSNSKDIPHKHSNLSVALHNKTAAVISNQKPSKGSNNKESVIKGSENNPDKSLKDSNKVPVIKPNVPSSTSNRPENLPKGKDWEKKMTDHGTESCVRLVDVDSDGILDIVFGISTAEGLGEVLRSNLTLKEVCKQKNMPYPCLGYVVALRGTDGEVIWKSYVRSATIFLNCEDFDINQDGQKDCIVSGRRATIQAIDSKTGKTLWLADETFIKPKWNVYQALALPDFDKDGVPEVLVANGGDPNKEPTDHNRHSGRLMILSGATGKKMGNRYLAMPNNKEIYMSPVMYTTKDGSQYILFGSGGETVPGNFYIISVPDFYRYVMEVNDDTDVPGVKGEYEDWSKFVKDRNTGLMTILRGETKGFMVPPVIVDVNNDGTEDILVSSYSGAVILLNGRDLSTIWTAEFPYMESYTTPAPGYFNDDDVLDFMVHWSLGVWPQYNYTQNVILDGKDGSKLFIMNSTQYQMSSDLTVHTTQEYRDLFIIKVKGRGSHISMDWKHGIQGLPRTEKLSTTPNIKHIQFGANHGPLGNPGSDNEQRFRRHEEIGKKHYLSEESLAEIFQDYSSRHFLCSDVLDISSEVLLFDRTSSSNPIKITETTTKKFNYSVPDQRNETMVNMCVIVMPDDRTTAAIGDVDGDGILDIVTLVGMWGEKVDAGYSYMESLYFTYIKKISLGSVIKENDKKVSARTQLSFRHNPEEVSLADLDILPRDQQTWIQYLGKKGNSHYGRESQR